MKEKYIGILRKELDSLLKSSMLLTKTYSKCKSIGIKLVYVDEELEQFEVLTGRFSRTSDLLIQKILRLIDLLEYEVEGTVIDRINRAEKRGLITTADIFAEVRLVRNIIAHEYEPDDITKIFKKVMTLTPLLLEAIDKTETYARGLLK